MKLLTLMVLIACLHFAAMKSYAIDCSSQTILSLTEHDEDNGTHCLSETQPMADIFSTISIQINKNELRTQLPPSSESSSLNALLTRMGMLQDAVTEGLKGLPAMQRAMIAYSETNRTDQDLRQLRKGLSPGLDKVQMIIKISDTDPRFRATLNQVLRDNKSVMAKIAGIFEAARREVDLLQGDLDSVAKKEGVYFQLGAWIDERPQHLEGFDTYPLGQTFQVERWQFALTDKQKEQLSTYEKFAKDANEDGLQKALSDNLKTFAEIAPVAMKGVTGNLSQSSSRLEKSLSEIVTSCKKLVSSKKTAVAEAVTAIRQEKESYEFFVRSIQMKYESGGEAYLSGGAALLQNVNNDLGSLKTRTTTTVENIDAVIGQLQSMAKGDASIKDFAAAINNLANSVQALNDSLKDDTDFARLQQLASTLINGKRIDAALLSFGAEVSKLDLASMPEKTTLSLNKLAQPGETLTVKIAVGRPAKDDEKKARLSELEFRQVQLFKVLPHIDTAVSLIFARNNGVFQLAPSYSWLFKPGCRGSVLYNRIIDAGFGLNLSALDFDKDSTPELGLGIVVSAVRDYLQLGYGFNINLNKFYLFFGLRLPIPTLH